MAMTNFPRIIAATMLGLSLAAALPIISPVVLDDGSAHAYGPPAPGSGTGDSGSKSGGTGDGSGRIGTGN